MIQYLKGIIIIYLFCGSNLVGYFGIKDVIFQSTMVLLSLLPMIYYYRGWLKETENLILMLFLLVFLMFFNWIERGPGVLSLSMSIIGAPIMFFSLPNIKTYKSLNYLRFWHFVVIAVLASFLINSGVALLERLLGYTVLGLRGGIIYEMEDIGEVKFRSTAIYGHPLKNALITSTLMSYVLVSSLKTKIKFSLWFLGFAAVLCFNTRAAIVGNTLLLTAYLVKTELLNHRLSLEKKVQYILAGILITVAVYVLIKQGGLAGRLMTMGLFDEGSAQARINIWDVFKYHKLSEFLFGLSNKTVELMAYSVGVSIIENFWLIYLFRFGLIFLIIYVILYFFFFKKLFEQYRLFDKLFVIVTFVGFASTNNSLASGFMTLWYFLLLSIIFNPKLFPKIVKHQYLEGSSDDNFRFKLRNFSN